MDNGQLLEKPTFFIRILPLEYVGAAILPPATYRLQPVRLNGTTRYTEQCSGDDSSPRQGLAPLDVTNTNVQRLRPGGRMAAGCRRYSGYTIMRVVPFTPTGYTSNVAGDMVAAPTYFNEWIQLNNVSRPNNCQLSTVNCQLGFPPFTDNFLYSLFTELPS